MTSKTNFHGVGRRKSAVARVWLNPSSKGIIINGKDYDTYLSTEDHKISVRLPLNLTGKLDEVGVKVNVFGGGITGQADAIKLGIARALNLMEPSLRTILKAAKLLTVDAREVERKKPGRKKARKRFQFVKR